MQEQGKIISLIIYFSDESQEEMICHWLEEQGVPFDQIVLESSDRLSVCVFFEEEQKARNLRDGLEQAQIADMDIQVKEWSRAQWLTKWQEDWKPFLITADIRIVPRKFSEDPVSADQRGDNVKDVIIETENVFGSGVHPTTRWCARMIERIKGQFVSVLDVGIGTGILSLVAFCYGTREVWGVDIDPEAIDTARKNFECNQRIPHVLRVCDIAQFDPKRSFDLVIANMISPDLVVYQKKICSWVKPKSFLIVSGISLANEDSFRARFARDSFRVIDDVREEGWCAILYQKEA